MMPTLYAYHGLRLRLGEHGPVLVLKPGGSRVDRKPPEFVLVPEDGRWRLPATADLAGSHVELSAGTKPPPAIRGLVFIEQLALAPAKPDHPALDVVAWVVEGSSPTDPTLAVEIEGDVQPDGFSEGFNSDAGRRRNVTPAFAGTVWVRHGDARLAIGVLPRNLVSAEEVRQATRGSLDAPVRSALARLDRIVRDLWAWSLHRSDMRATPGAVVHSGSLKADWFQRLARLHELVHHRGVRDAWQAIAADPVVRLITEFPVVPLSRARVPTFHGSRGPWSLSRGWSPERPLGDVRERVVERTVDTPPNRLAVALAARVVDEIDEILAGRDDARIHNIAEPLRQAALDTLYAPSLRGIDHHAPLALDSPSLQANTRCRPLLDAWHQMTQGVEPDPLRLDDLMLEPLARTHQLYERWCFVRLVEIVEATLGPGTKTTITKHAGKSEEKAVLEAICSRTADKITVTVYHAADGAVIVPPEEEDNEEGVDERANARTKSSSKTWEDQKLTTSWSPVSRPDGFLVVRKGGNLVAVHAWDAKYRPLWSGKSRDAGYMYQAHAFRDAVRWTKDTKNGNAHVSWSLVFHPGLAGSTITEAAYTVGGNGRSTAFNDVGDWRRGGVAIAALAPPPPDAPADKRLPVHDLIAALCLTKTTT